VKLNDESIRHAQHCGDLKFDGSLRRGALLLTLGHVAQRLNKRASIVDPINSSSLAEYYLPPETINEKLPVAPGEFILVAAAEALLMPNYITGLLSTLSHVARFGLMTQPNSYVISPSFAGYITLELQNLGCATLQLTPGMPLAKILLFSTETDRTNSTTPDFFYGASFQLASRYADEFQLET
jgi:deoxycytidine triphosphate deaminase